MSETKKTKMYPFAEKEVDFIMHVALRHVYKNHWSEFDADERKLYADIEYTFNALGESK